MNGKRHGSLPLVASVALGIFLGGFVAYHWMRFEFGVFAALHYDSAIQNLASHQRILKELDDGNLALATELLEGQINGEIHFADSLLTADYDGLNQGHRDSVNAILKDISDYRNRGDFEDRVQYVNREEPGDPEVNSILARYQADAP